MEKIIFQHAIGLFLLVIPVLIISAEEQNPETNAQGHQKMSLVSAVPELVIIDAYPDGDV